MLLYWIFTVCKVLQISFLTLWPLKLRMGQMGGQWNHVAPFPGRNIKGTVGKVGKTQWTGFRKSQESGSQKPRSRVKLNVLCSLNDYQTTACYFATTRETENTRSVGCQVSWPFSPVWKAECAACIVCYVQKSCVRTEQFWERICPGESSGARNVSLDHLYTAPSWSQVSSKLGYLWPMSQKRNSRHFGSLWNVVCL